MSHRLQAAIGKDGIHRQHDVATGVVPAEKIGTRDGSEGRYAHHKTDTLPRRHANNLDYGRKCH